MFIGLVGAVAAAAICVASGIDTKSERSDLMQKNLEALSWGEGGSTEYDCLGGSVECARINTPEALHK